MQNRVKVSILMNGYNAQKYLKEAIDSIYAQTFDDWEIIFIDNCSTDNTKEIIDSYDNKIKYYKTDKNIPLGAARNFGLKYCNGEYLAFLDTDDIWLKNKLEKQIKILDLNKKLQMCYSGVIYIDSNSKEIGKLSPKAIDGNVFVQQLKKYEINMQSVIIRNNIEIHFNEALEFSPDFNLFMFISLRYNVCVIKDCLVKYRKLDSSLTSKKMDRWWFEMKYTLDDIFNQEPELKTIYYKEYKMAYAKVAYYKARYLMDIGRKREAINELVNYRFTNKVYFVLYIISLLPKTVWDFIHRLKSKKYLQTIILKKLGKRT
jgi:glycosyltransferase involved in cell wall biosynthesis